MTAEFQIVPRGTPVPAAPARAESGPIEIARGSVLGDTWSSFKRWGLKSLRNPFVVTFSLVQPIIWLALFTQVLSGIFTKSGALPPGVTFVQFFAPTVVIQAAIFASSGSGIGLVEDMRFGVFNKLLASPVHRGAMFAGKTLAETTRVAIQVAIILALAIAIGANVATGPLGALGVLAFAILFYLGFGAFANIVGLLTKSMEATIIISNFLVLPLLFTSDAFAPISTMPAWLQVVAKANPVTYGIDAVRQLMLKDWDWNVLGKSLAFLAIFDVALLVIAALMLRRATEAKAR
ncbi:MAG: ABC transporter permease [Thermoplasmatota archaeon]